jgi:hypothetical protein
VRSDVRLVGHQDDGDIPLDIELVQETHHFGAVPGIEVPRRFVREQDRGLGHQRAGDGDPLLLATGQL